MEKKQKRVVTELEYLGMSGWQKFCYRFVTFFRHLPVTFLHFFTATIPALAHRFWDAFSGIFKKLWIAMKNGDWKTRLSFVIMGFGQLARGQVMRGLVYLIFEILFILFMALFGAGQLALFGGPGYAETTEAGWVTDPVTGVDKYVPAAVGDNSLLILLYGILTMIFIIAFVYAWYSNVKAAYYAQEMKEAGQRLPSAKDDLHSFADGQYHKTLLAIPLLGLVIFTIFPIIFMVFVAFTNYDMQHMPPAHLFQWNGFANFQAVFGGSLSGGTQFGMVFGRILLWTVIWAIFATFTNYLLGMVVAIMINKKGIKLKKLWRTVLIMTVAVPQFVSLLLMSQMLGDYGIVNSLLQKWGITSGPIKFLSDGTVAKATIILVNIWIGIPYTMLMVSGILMNIPADLYESARIDGAGPFRQYFKITLPYVLHVTTPYLISNFVGNLNNFGVIYLLTGGGPTMAIVGVDGAGETDLLITWLYKLIMDKKLYGVASVISILMFLITGIISLVTYNRSASVKNEEDFM